MNKTTVFLALALFLPMGYAQAQDLNDLTLQAMESNDPSPSYQESMNDSRDQASQSADDSRNEIESEVDDSKHEVEDSVDDSRDEAEHVVEDSSHDEIKQETVDSTSTDPQS